MIKHLSLLLILVVIISGCNNAEKLHLEQEQAAIKEKAASINNDFKKIRLEVDTLATAIVKLYEKQDEIIPAIDTKKYQLASNGVFTKPVDDGGSAIFVSGFYPVTETGTGLGLILCKEFIEKHRGQIWVESKEGQGSIFTFAIPVNP